MILELRLILITFQFFHALQLNTGRNPKNMTSYKCLKCEDGPFARRHALESHLYERHCGNIFPMKCNLCESEFRSMYNLKRHYERMHSIYSQPHSECFVVKMCPYCESTCLDYYDLQNHISLNHQHWKISSKVKSVNSQNHRIGKKKTVESFLVPSNDKFACLITGCGAKYPSRKLLNAHLKDHSLKNSPICERCGKHIAKYSNSDSLEETVDSNIDKNPTCPCKVTRPFECHENEFCKKAYKAAWLLARHSLSKHKNVTSTLVCKYCRTQFKSEKSLLEHLKVHFHPKSYHCEDCGDRFNQRSALTRHIATIHNLRRSNFCCVCGLSFSQSGNLKVHLKKVHDLKCKKCFGVYRATDVADLEDHVKNCQEKPIFLMEDDFNDVMEEIEIPGN